MNMKDSFGKEYALFKICEFQNVRHFCPYEKESESGFPRILAAISTHRQLCKPLQTQKGNSVMPPFVKKGKKRLAIL